MTDDEKRLDESLLEADPLLVASLQNEEQARRKRVRSVVTAAGLGFMFVGALYACFSALADLEEAMPDGPEELNMAGWQYFESGRWSEAEERFRSLTALEPEEADGWNGLGWSLLNGGRHTNALEAFEKAVQLSANHPGAHNGLGHLHFMRRDYEKAETHWLKASPQASATWQGLAMLYLLKEDFESARTWAEKAAQQDPENEFAERILAAAKNERLDDDLRRAIEPAERYTTSREAHEGWALINQRKYNQAQKIFESALEKNPDDFDAHNGLSFVLLEGGDVAGAKAHLGICLEMRPDAPGPLNGMARCLKAEGNVEEAIAVWKRMVELSPSPNAGTTGLASTYLEQGRYREALPYFEELVEAFPDERWFRRGLRRARRGIDNESAGESNTAQADSRN